jgi:amino acid transporter
MDRRALKLIPLAMTIFCCVSGGPFGLEAVVSGGPGIGLLLILGVPIIWGMPSALMTAELSSAIPVEGGFYHWTKRSLGPFWGFLAGWWTWLYTWVDAALYPVLFATYISSLIQLLGHASPIESNPWIKWAVGLAMVIPLTWLNIRGTKVVGMASVIFALIFLTPFAILVVLGMSKLLGNPSAAWTPMLAPGSSFIKAAGAGLYIAMWNYLGWDDLSTITGEVENPQKTFPRALLIAVILTIAAYLLPTLVGVVAVPDYASWEEGTWTKVGQAIGGSWLGILIVAAGLFSAMGLFASTLLASSRIPFVLGEDGWLPQAVTRLHPKYGTPWIAILISAVVYTTLSFQAFESLVVIDVLLDSSAILLELIALAVLRWKEPDLPRPYKIPGGWFGIAYVVLCPIAIVAFAVYYSVFIDEELGFKSLWMAAAALATGPVFYWIVARRKGIRK